MLTQREGDNVTAGYNTVRSLGQLKSSIEDYGETFGYYPCPADPAATSLRGAGSGTGTCTASNLISGDGVVMGAIPVITLSLPFSTANDAYGNRLMYAVTQSLTGSMGPGNIRILKDYDNSRAVDSQPENEITDAAAFVIISYGKDGVGAYDHGGTARKQAPLLQTGERADSEYQTLNHHMYADPPDNSFFAPRVSLQGELFDDHLIWFVIPCTPGDAVSNLPADVQNPLIWLDGQDDCRVIRDEAGLVSAWNDKGSAGMDATPPDAAARPVYNETAMSGNRPSLNFDTSSRLLLLKPSGIDAGASWTTSAVFDAPIAPHTSWHTLIRRTSLDNHIITSRGSNILGTYEGNGGGFRASYAGGYGFDLDDLPAGQHMISAVGTGTTTDFYMDGAYAGSADRKGRNNMYTIGNTQTGAQNWGEIGEVFIYNSDLAADLDDIETYLSNKWNITKLDDCTGGKVLRGDLTCVCPPNLPNEGSDGNCYAACGGGAPYFYDTSCHTCQQGYFWGYDIAYSGASCKPDCLSGEQWFTRPTPSYYSPNTHTYHCVGSGESAGLCIVGNFKLPPTTIINGVCGCQSGWTRFLGASWSNGWKLYGCRKN